jgi:hypothetical protein
MHKTTSGKATYIVSFGGAFDEASGASFSILGTPAASTVYPSDIIGESSLVTVSVGTSELFSREMNIEVQPDTILSIVVDPNNTTAAIHAWFVTVELPPSGSKFRTREQVLAEANPTNTKFYSGYHDNPSAVSFFLEYTVNDKLIQQPRVAGAVADELYVVSTGAADTGAGAGARTIKFNYLDASLEAQASNAISLTGTTPVNIVGTYGDVFVITEAWVVTAGANGRNLGDILFQDVTP